MRKRIRDLQQLWPEASITVSGRNHLRLTWPDGTSYYTGSTPSDKRHLRNLMADVKRLRRPVQSTESQ